MTETDELRHMLDERGVEWTSGSTEVSRNICTDLRPDTGVTISVWESRDGKLGIDAHTDYLFTPEQVVEATLGRGECHDKNGFDPELGFECTACGAMVDTYMVTPMEMGHVRQFAYCPFCGRHVVEVGE